MKKPLAVLREGSGAIAATVLLQRRDGGLATVVNEESRFDGVVYFRFGNRVWDACEDGPANRRPGRHGGVWTGLLWCPAKDA